MTDTAELIALLTATPQEAAVDLDDGAAYLDWSSREEDGRISLELGDGTDAVAVAVTRDQLVAAYRALGTWLIQNPT